MLKSIPKVRPIEISSSKKKFLKEFELAIYNLNLVKQGKLKARDARVLLDNLKK